MLETWPIQFILHSAQSLHICTVPILLCSSDFCAFEKLLWIFPSLLTATGHLWLPDFYGILTKVYMMFWWFILQSSILQITRTAIKLVLKKISKAIPKSTVCCCEKIPLACRAQLCARKKTGGKNLLYIKKNFDLCVCWMNLFDWVQWM